MKIIVFFYTLFAVDVDNYINLRGNWFSILFDSQYIKIYNITLLRLKSFKQLSHNI